MTAATDLAGEAGEDILLRVIGGVGHVTLNRPKALNALTYAMATALERALLAWRDDASVRMVLIDAAGEKAFCAGGDIQDLYAAGRAGDYDFGRKFWADEYRLNALIAAYPKPYVALMDGIVMGGGVGVSAHGSHRIVTERTILAMPECAIGLIPDVGGSWLLARAPRHVGEYVGLTGVRLGAGDAIHIGFADRFVPAGQLGALRDALLATADPAVLDDFAAPAPPATLAEPERAGAIEAIFGMARLGDMLDALAARQAAGDAWAEATLAALARGCPLSLACALDVIREVRRRGASLEEAIGLEYRFSARCSDQGDFLEGVRAAIIDKDRKPSWRHASVREVTDETVAAMLAPVDDDRLVFHQIGQRAATQKASGGAQ